MKKGDLVVFRNARGTQLKRKVFTVVDPHVSEGGYAKMRIADAFGKQKNDTVWYYVPIDDYESALVNRVQTSVDDVDKARKRVNRNVDNLKKFQAEKDKASSWFPKV